MIWLHSVFKVTENVGVFLVTHALTCCITDKSGCSKAAFLVNRHLVSWSKLIWKFLTGWGIVELPCWSLLPPFQALVVIFWFHTWLHHPFFALASWATFSRSLLVEKMLNSASSSMQPIIPRYTSGQGVGTSSLSIAKSDKMGLFYSNRKKGLPRWLNGKESCQCRRHRFSPWVGKTIWRRKWQPTPVFLPGKFHGQGSLVGYSPWGCKSWIQLTTKPATIRRKLISQEGW